MTLFCDSPFLAKFNPQTPSEERRIEPPPITCFSVRKKTRQVMALKKQDMRTYYESTARKNGMLWENRQVMEGCGQVMGRRTVVQDCLLPFFPERIMKCHGQRGLR